MEMASPLNPSPALTPGLGRILAAAAARIVLKPRTPSLAGGEARLVEVTLGGVPQWVLIRGRRRSSPVLLFLHGGPAMPSMYLAHRFQAGLEHDFLVVHWDRYGAGKSWNGAVDKNRLRTSREVDDAVELIGWLQARYDCGPVLVVGHSYGAYVAVALALRAPHLVRALIGVGLMTVSHAEETRAQEAWLRQQAEVDGDQGLLKRLNRRPGEDRGEDVFRRGGGVVGLTSPLALGALALEASEYSLADMARMAGGIRAAHRHFVLDGPALPLLESVARLEIPLYALMGRFDRITSTGTVAPWYRAVEAPVKRWFDFEHSAHLPFLEEPERFADVVRKVASETSRPGAHGTDRPARCAG